MQNLENIFQRIDNEFRDLKQAENSNVDEIRKILNRQAEALSYLVTRVKDLEQRLEVEETWDSSVEEVGSITTSMSCVARGRPWWLLATEPVIM